MQKYSLFCTICIALFLQSCATYNTKYDSNHTGWASIADSMPIQDSIAHTVFLVGDAGYKSYEAPALIAMKKQTDAADENTTIVFLGDNIYPGGMPPADSFSTRLEAERRIIAQMDIIDDCKGSGFFVNGNHDTWYFQTKGAHRQADFINAYLNRGIEDEDDWKEYFLPDKGCSGPEVVEVNDNLAIIAINSQWWLMNWERDPNINYGCDVKTRGAFRFWFEETLRKHRNKNVIVVMHHALNSYGPHGGRFTVKEHIFPLTQLNKNMYIPLVGVGTVAALVRAAVGLRQDISNPLYVELKDALLDAAKKNGNFIFASGHEHNLQYIEDDGQYFIVSGSGSKQAPVALGQHALFTSGLNGFAKVEFHHNGSAWVTYYGATKDKLDGFELFRHKIRGPLPLETGVKESEITDRNDIQATYLSSVTTRDIKAKGSLYNFFYGDNYRNLYMQEYELPGLLLDTFAGGLEVVKVGGGGQTNSLRLENPEGRQYVLRSTTKDASRFIPYPFNRITPVKDVVEESFLAAHPFGATVLPPLAKAANVYHTNPKLYYVPKQPALGRYNELFGDEVFLLEERPDDEEWEGAAYFGDPDEIIGTDDVIENIRKSEKHIVDQNWVLRSRLFDLLIGDWDRHDDQWRWTVIELDDDIKLYRPIPRDRDQAFSRYDGLVGSISRQAVPFTKQLREYRPEVGNIKWNTYNGRQFDMAFLNKMTWEDFQAEAQFLKEHLTDEVIDAAFATWPQKVQDDPLTGHIIHSLKTRRDNVLSIAKKYYHHVNKEVEITATNDPDFIEIDRSDDSTRVQVWEYKKGKRKDLIFDRQFINDHTKEIRIFAFEAKDSIVVRGEASKGIRIRIIGGEGKDKIYDYSKVGGFGKKTKIYDDKKGNIIEPGTEGKDLSHSNNWFNQYHRRDAHYEYDFMMTFPKLGYTPDNGVFLGADLTFTKFAYKKRPYAEQHTVGGFYTFQTNGFRLNYRGELKQVFGNWDFLFESHFNHRLFTYNYFGYGNESEAPFLDQMDFNRVRQSSFAIRPGVQKYFGTDRGRFHFGLSGEYFNPLRTPGRITDVENAELSGLTDAAFEERYYAGIFGSVNYENTNHQFLPTRGMKFSVGGHFRQNIQNSSANFAKFWSKLTFYQTFFRNQRMTLASQVGWEQNTGKFNENFQFYHAATLGSNSNLRGYRQFRFHGKSIFFHNTDVRVKVLSSDQNRLFSSSIGVLGGFDYGRTWDGLEGPEQANIWHYGYGGGLWIAPLDFFMILGEYFMSDEDELFTVNIRYAF